MAKTDAEHYGVFTRKTADGDIERVADTAADAVHLQFEGWRMKSAATAKAAAEGAGVGVGGGTGDVAGDTGSSPSNTRSTNK